MLRSGGIVQLFLNTIQYLFAIYDIYRWKKKKIRKIDDRKYMARKPETNHEAYNKSGFLT